MKSISYIPKPILVFLIAVGLGLLTIVWVPFNPEIIRPAYYNVTLFQDIRPRALIGTFAAILGLSPYGFILMMQAFKMAWVIMLSMQIFRWVKDPVIALALCFLFVFNSVTYIDNAATGQIDMAGNFWLLIAANIFIACPKQNSAHLRWRVFLCLVFISLAILTHEKSIFPAAILVLWILIRFGKKVWPILPAYLLLAAVYLSITWHKMTNGLSASGYVNFVHDNPFGLFFLESFSVYGVLTSIGMLWIVYGVAVYRSIQMQPDKTATFMNAAFIMASLAASFAPLMFAVDSQRIIGVIWLPLYLHLYDQVDWLKRLGPSWKMHCMCALVCLVHLFIPPTFIVGRLITPLNCYSARNLPSLSRYRLLILPKPYQFPAGY